MLVELGFRIPVVGRIPDSLSCIPDSKARGFHIPLWSKNFPNSGFHKQKLPRYRNQDLHRASHNCYWQPQESHERAVLFVAFLQLWSCYLFLGYTQCWSQWETSGGSLAERLERRICNSEAPSSSPALTAHWICSRQSRVQVLAMLVNSQLVCLWPVGILQFELFVSGICSTPLVLVL